MAVGSACAGYNRYRRIHTTFWGPLRESRTLSAVLLQESNSGREAYYDVVYYAGYELYYADNLTCCFGSTIDGFVLDPQRAVHAARCEYYTCMRWDARPATARTRS